MKMSQKDKVEWRRDQVQQLLAKGHYSHREISSILQIPKSTISRDIQYLSHNAKNSIRKYIDERLPEEYEKCLVGLTPY
jgi:IS30 family transposase